MLPDRPAPRGLGAVGLLPPQRRKLTSQQQSQGAPAYPSKLAPVVNNGSIIETGQAPASPTPSSPLIPSAEAGAAVHPLDTYENKNEEEQFEERAHLPAQSFRSAALPEPPSATRDEVEVGSPPQQAQREERRAQSPPSQEAKQQAEKEQEEEQGHAADNNTNVQLPPSEGPIVRPRRQPTELWNSNAAANQPDAKGATGKRSRKQQQVETQAVSKKHKTDVKDMRESLVADLLGKVIQVPGKVFGVDDPFKYFIGDVVGPDPKRKNAVVLVFRDDNSRYWFPASNARGWLKDMRLRGIILPTARNFHTEEKEKEKEAPPNAGMAAEVLAQISGSVSEGGKEGAVGDGAVTQRCDAATKSEASRDVGKSRKKSKDRVKN